MAKQNLGHLLNKLQAENNTLKHELRKWKEVKPGGSKVISLQEVCEAQQIELYEMKKWNETLAASLASAIEKHEAYQKRNFELSERLEQMGKFIMPEEPAKPKRKAPAKKKEAASV